MTISPGRASSAKRRGRTAMSTRSRTAVFDIRKKNRGLRMITGTILANSLKSCAGAQTVFQGAPAPGGVRYADLTASKLIGINLFVYMLIRQNLTRNLRP